MKSLGILGWQLVIANFDECDVQLVLSEDYIYYDTTLTWCGV